MTDLTQQLAQRWQTPVDYVSADSVTYWLYCVFFTMLCTAIELERFIDSCW